MKKILYTIFVFFIVQSLMLIENCFAQWEPDFQLSYSPQSSNTSFNNAWCIAANGNLVHAVWYERYNSEPEIWYARSTDSGIDFIANTQLTFNSGISENPSVALSGTIVHVIWADNSDGNWEIYYKRSTNSGVSWEADTRLTNDPATSRNSSLAVSGSNVHVVWRDNRNGGYEIYYKLSTDGGASWGVDTRLTNYTSGKINLSIAVSGSNLHIVWQENRDGNSEIYYKRSTNSGTDWEADTRLTNDTAQSLFPSISVSGSNIHIVWHDFRDGNWEIYYKRSTNSGLNWATDIRLTNEPTTSTYPSIAVSGSIVHIVWVEILNGNNPEIYYKRSVDFGMNWEVETRLTNEPGASVYPSIAVTNTVAHVIWQDDRLGFSNTEIYYKRNPNGNVVSIQNISTETPSIFSLSQNYPNPFNPVTNIKFSIPKTGFVKLTVYDITGRVTASLVNTELTAGTYSYDFDASNLASGIYFCRLESGGFTQSNKMVLIK